MRTYYQDAQVQITSTAIWVEDQRYELAELESMWRRTGSIAGRRVLVTGGALLATLMVRAGTSPTLWIMNLRRNYLRWFALGGGRTALVAAGALAVAVASFVTLELTVRAIEDIRGHGRHRELWVSVRGEPVLVLSTNDSVRFGKVSRALVRAMGNR